ncbi:MAG: metal-dependent hydrolase [Euryarchaeota archaeon]|nr:metal-dependent hydrolase [Euryarchaeota archaeon]MDE1837348.1 metal-dependent hydrolase [Euryarchaeota archaeon]MDE1880920.1 metal-dependent hydrolase [Euryarchaeota archaeon]MDE2045626.1 metal-dependent hydrolase [Thermoplasmata archaeon]
MDLFTHVIFAYLLSFVLWGPATPWYIAAGAMAGGLPDSDVLFYPLAKRFPLLRHHGITHSILGATAVAGAGSVIVPYILAPFIPGTPTDLAAGTTLRFFVAMLLGGLSHVFLDGFTHFSVPPLAPFSHREFALHADRAINLGMTALTVATLVTLIWENRNPSVVPVSLWIETAWVLVVIYGGYLVARGLGRWRAGEARASGGYSAVIPTGNPVVWFLVDETITPERYHLRYRRYVLGKGYTMPERTVDVAKSPRGTGPVLTPQEALNRSYAPAMQKNGFLHSSYHFGEAERKGAFFEVVWYSIEFAMLGRAPGVRVRVEAESGKVQFVGGNFLRPPAAAGI